MKIVNLLFNLHGKMIQRDALKAIEQSLQEYPAVGILGPRQIGKTTLARQIATSQSREVVFLDLENPENLAQLSEPSLFLRANENKLVILDEVQRIPELFPLLRVLIDEKRIPGRFLVLGSASPELLRQSSESLAGRMAYHELPPLLLNEQDEKGALDYQRLLVRGGFPLAYLAENDAQSFRWRTNFIRSYTERDLPLLGFNPDPPLALRFLRMIASLHGQSWNAQALGKSLDLTHPTINKYRDFLESAFLVRVLKPYSTNLKKRLVKAPKVYIRDSGILHNLLQVSTFDELLGQAWGGFSWEGFAIENILHTMPVHLEPFYIRSHQGAEIDLLLVKNNQPFIALKMKLTNSPKLPKGFTFLVDELKTPHNFIVTPSGSRFPLRKDIEAISLPTLMIQLQDL